MSIFSDYLILGNVWDVASVVRCQKAGFTAIGTSSAAVAASLGYEDGENMPFEALLRVVKAIVAKVDLPLTVDIEGGYSRNIDVIISNIALLSDLGVAGINIEDSVINDNERHLLPANEFAQILGDIKLAQPNMFINARTDPYILGVNEPLTTTLNRAKLYAAAGADGLFVPCITDINDIKTVVDAIKLPLNVMCMPALPGFDSLKKIGVKRISMGPFAYNRMMEFFENSMKTILHQQNFGAMFRA